MKWVKKSALNLMFNLFCFSIHAVRMCLSRMCLWTPMTCVSHGWHSLHWHTSKLEQSWLGIITMMWGVFLIKCSTVTVDLVIAAADSSKLLTSLLSNFLTAQQSWRLLSCCLLKCLCCLTGYLKHNGSEAEFVHFL